MDLCINKGANLLSMAIKKEEDSYPDENDIESNCY